MFAPVDGARVAHVVSTAAVALVLAGGFTCSGPRPPMRESVSHPGGRPAGLWWVG